MSSSSFSSRFRDRNVFFILRSLKNQVISTSNLGCYVNGKWKASGPVVSTSNPANNQAIAEVVQGSIEDYEEGMRSCAEAAKVWMQVPAPKRGEIVRQIGDALRNKLPEFLVGLCPLRLERYCLKE